MIGKLLCRIVGHKWRRRYFESSIEGPEFICHRCGDLQFARQQPPKPWPRPASGTNPPPPSCNQGVISSNPIAGTNTDGPYSDVRPVSFVPQKHTCSAKFQIDLQVDCRPVPALTCFQCCHWQLLFAQGDE